MNFHELRNVITQIQFPDYIFVVGESSHGFTYLQGVYEEADTITGEMETQYTRRWALSPMMTKSEVVATAFKCVMTSAEHRVREHFLYQNKAIYQPHHDVDKLLEICDERSVRADALI
jgi:hypothetical protein